MSHFTRESRAISPGESRAIAKKMFTSEFEERALSCFSQCSPTFFKAVVLLSQCLLLILSHTCQAVRPSSYHAAQFQSSQDKRTRNGGSPPPCGLQTWSPGQERAAGAGVIPNCVCCGSQQASDWCTVREASCPVVREGQMSSLLSTWGKRTLSRCCFWNHSSV